MLHFHSQKLLLSAGLLLISSYCCAQAIFVDPVKGNDNSPGSSETPLASIGKAVEKLASATPAGNAIIKLRPGLYALMHSIKLKLPGTSPYKRLVIEAAVMPDDPKWAPESMPVIMSEGPLEQNFGFDCSVGFMAASSYISIRGLKFLGNPNPAISLLYYPVGREDTVLTDLNISQCVFVGDEFSSPVQSGVLSCGNATCISHCIFYNCRNGIVFWRVHDKAVGNSLTNSIIYGAYQSGFWTAHNDSGFQCHNNVISKCKFAWIKNYYNTASYKFQDCIISDNEYFRGEWDQPDTLVPVKSRADLQEINVAHEGEIKLTGLKTAYTGMDPIMLQEYLNIRPGSVGASIGAGIFEKRP